MGNTPSKPHHYPSSHPPSASKSRHQHPQYNPDNESSAQLGQASSEHLYALGLAKWDTGTSDEAVALHTPSPTDTSPIAEKASSAPGESKKGNKKKSKKKAVVKEVYTIRETVDTARASIEAVRGSPAIRPGTMRDESLHEQWGAVNEWHCEMELAGMGSWMEDVGKERK